MCESLRAVAKWYKPIVGPLAASPATQGAQQPQAVHRVLGGSSMKVRLFAVAALAAILAVAASTASAHTSRAAASKITVWLQVDAQTGWPELVAAGNQQFQAAHPGVSVDVQYQTWPDHLGKFDATLAGGNAPDVIEIGNTAMTKDMAAGAFSNAPADKGAFASSGNWLRGLAASGAYQGKTFGVPYYAGSRV